MNKHVMALRSLRDRDEAVIDGAVWLKCGDIKQYKVSPLGTQGDYDTASFWVSFDALEEHFAGNFCGQVVP